MEEYAVVRIDAIFVQCQAFGQSFKRVYRCGQFYSFTQSQLVGRLFVYQPKSDQHGEPIRCHQLVFHRRFGTHIFLRNSTQFELYSFDFKEQKHYQTSKEKAIFFLDKNSCQYLQRCQVFIL